MGERHIDCDHVDRLTTRDLGGFEKGGGERVTWIKNLWWIIKKSVSGETVVDIGTGGKWFGWYYGMEWVVTRLLMKPG